MGLNASKGRKNAIDKIYPRHFLSTAKVVKFPEEQMYKIMQELAEQVPQALERVIEKLPIDFSKKVKTSIATNVLRLHTRLSGSL